MSTRNPMNKRSQAQQSGEARGFARKSAASAKPARTAAGSVHVVPASSKARRAQQDRGEDLSGLTKEEKRARKRELRAQEDRVYAASNELMKDDPAFKGRRRVFWVLLGVGMVATLALFILMTAAPDLASIAWVQIGGLVIGYACVIGAFIYDTVRIRPIRNEARAKAEGMSARKLDEYLEQKTAANRREIDEAASKKKSSSK